MRYEIITGADSTKAIRCRACGLISHHPEDVANRYCARCSVFHEQEFLREFGEELRELEASQPILLEITPLLAWILLAQIQLVCRHPGNTGPSRQFIESFARDLQQRIAPSGALAEMAERGWQQEFDV